MVAHRYSIDTSLASMIQQVPLITSIPFLPLSGFIVDRVGRRCELMIFSFVIITSMYIMMLAGPTFPNKYEHAALMWTIVPAII